MKDKIIIIGGGGHATVLISILKKINKFVIAGYTDNMNFGEIIGAKYLGNDDVLVQLYSNGVRNAALGIGQVNLTLKRQNVTETIKHSGFNFPAIISPDSTVNESVSVGEGVQIFDGVVVNSNSKIGNFTTINTNSTVEHDCIIGNFCHVATGAVLSGGVEIGDYSMIGANAVVVQYKRIASNCLIGAGGVVINNIETRGIYVGNPVRKIK